MDLEARILEMLRNEQYLSLPPQKIANHLGITRQDLADAVRQSPHLELTSRSGRHGEFQVLGIALTPEALAALTPFSYTRMCRAWPAAQRRRLHEVFRDAVQRGLIRQIEDEVLVGEGQAQSVSEESKETLTALDWFVLNCLEDLEEEKISFALYETWTPLAEIHQEIQRREDNSAITDAEVRESLQRLRGQYQVLELGNDCFRSRISEIVRLLKTVKQRFRSDDASTAPFLIESLRARFVDRKRLERNRPLKPILGQLFQEHRTHGLRYLDRACETISKGFASSLRLPESDVRLTRVQEEALREIGSRYLQRKGGGLVITGNTGSGKTEASLLPLLLGAFQEKMTGIEGCKVLLVYPRQALARNQLSRVIRYLAEMNEQVRELRHISDRSLSVGILFGETPRDEHEMEAGSEHRRAWERSGDGWQLPYFQNEDGTTLRVVDFQDGICDLQSLHSDGSMAWELQEFRATRQAIQNNPPDLLIVTTEMLHRWLNDPEANELFGLATKSNHAPRFCPPRAVVFDEIHLYDTVHGAQVGMVLRRLRHRINQAMHASTEEAWQYPLTIGMSATIGQPGQFWQQLSGEKYVQEIVPTAEDLGQAVGRDYYLFLRPCSWSRGKRVGDASAAIQTIMTIAHNMVRRAGDEDEPARYRSLIFQDSIGKIKKLTLEYRDAETNRFLARHRFQDTAGDLESASFQDGETWYFDLHDPEQFSCRRKDPSKPVSLTSAEVPVFSGTGRMANHALQQDIIFATTSLEVGYDDPSIQFVLQHHAPKSPASFVQKKGRAGRSPNDRPITAVTLSRHSYRDAFYYQRPAMLYDPADYVPPLNVENYFVQRFQILALIFDELVRLTNRSQLRGDFATLDDHFASIDKDLARPEIDSAIQRAFDNLVAESFLRIHPQWRDVWQHFRQRMSQDDIQYRAGWSLLECCPDLPRNLFSTLNLPTIQVIYYSQGEWQQTEEDIAMAFSEITPGRVTRRYGVPWKHELFWRVPPARIATGSRIPDAIATERYKEKGNGANGPFDPSMIQSLESMWGQDWQQYLPVGVSQMYGNDVPSRFYRVRYYELWNFGTLNPAEPSTPQEDWHWIGVREGKCDVRLKFDRDGRERKNNPHARLVSSESTSYPMSFNVVKPTTPSISVQLPPLLPGVIRPLEAFFGEVDGERSVLYAHEIQYGAEALIRLLKKPGVKVDSEAGYVSMPIRYVSEHDGKPMLYGHDLTTEGIRARYDLDQLTSVAKQVREQLWQQDSERHHMQDRFLRYLLMSTPWPIEGVDSPLSNWDARFVAGLISTLRAEWRKESLDEFLNRLTTRDELISLIDTVGVRYCSDPRLRSDENLRESLLSTLTGPQAREHLSSILARVKKSDEIEDYLRDTILHSIEHALLHLFVIEGSTRDEETGSHAMLKQTFGHYSPDESIFIYERNFDGNGATRLLVDSLRNSPPGYVLNRWWNCSLACPVAEEEAFLRFILRNHADSLRQFSEEFFAASPGSRPSPRPLILSLTKDWLEADDPMLSRLAGILTAELSFAGEHVQQLHVQLELLSAHDVLSSRFGRPATSSELAGFVLHEIEEDGKRYPHLKRLYDIYERHSAKWDNDEDEDNHLGAADRFQAQIEHLSLTTCLDVCPACLASGCNQGPIEVMQYLLSRRALILAHRHLCSAFTREFGKDSVDDLVQLAQVHDGYLILEQHGVIDADYHRQLHDGGFQSVGRIVDFESSSQPVIRHFFHLREQS